MAKEARLGPYRIVSMLGEGGMGRAYRAIHEPLDRVVALKLLHPKVLHDPECRARFQREMRIAAALTHRGVMKVYDGGTHDGVDYLAMELVPGDTLDVAADKAPQAPWTYWIAVGACVADALGYLHKEGIVHRDLKHGNVKITPAGDVKILDFGLARAVDSTALTGADCWVGTFRYIAPEVLLGEPATPGSDLWSLGVMLHELLSGAKFLPERSLNTFARELIEQPLPPIAPGVGVPDEVAACVMKLLEREPSRRFPSATVAADELAQLLKTSGETTVEDALRSGVRAPKPRVATRARTANPERTRAERARLPWRRALALALVAGVLVALTALLVAPRPTTTGGEVRLLPAPSPSEAEDKLAAVPRTARWVAVEAEARRLRAGSLFAQRAMQELRAHTEVDLGDRPGAWLHWIEMGKWLDGPRDRPPPRWAEASRGPPPVEHDALLSALINAHLYADPVSHAIFGLRMTIEWPDDGRGWLVLGRVLEGERRDAAARAVYQIALQRFDATRVRSNPELVWAALARALIAVRGPELETAWLAAVASGTNPDKAWRGACDAFEESDPAVWERLLIAGVDDTRSGEAAAWRLARFYLKVKKDPARSIAALSAAARRWPASWPLTDAVIQFHLERGDLASALPWMGTPRARDRWQPVLARLREDDATPCDAASAPADPDRALLTALGWLERGCADQAEALAQKVPAEDDEEREERLPLLLELLGSGRRTPWIVEECRGLLARRKPSWELWAVAAGALSTRAGEPWMELLLEQAESRYPRAWTPKLARALWLARSGRHGAAIAQLARVPARERELPAEPFAEVLSRPLWMVALGDETAREAEAAARAVTPPPGDGPATQYLAKLRVGDLEGAAAVARAALAVNPDEPAWALALYTFGSLRNAPESYRLAKDRVRFGLRASERCAWLVREMRAVDKRAK